MEAYKCLSREPTQEMLDAARRKYWHDRDMQDLWRAMFDAAPAPAAVQASIQPRCFLHTLDEHPDGGLVCTTCGERTPAHDDAAPSSDLAARLRAWGTGSPELLLLTHEAAAALNAGMAREQAKDAEIFNLHETASLWPQDESRIYDAWHEAASRCAEQERRAEKAESEVARLTKERDDIDAFVTQWATENNLLAVWKAHPNRLCITLAKCAIDARTERDALAAKLVEAESGRNWVAASKGK